jgi:hypothetical protein
MLSKVMMKCPGWRWLVVSLLIVAGVAPAWGQNTFPTSGNVGIGTTSPGTPLDLQGAEVTARVKATSGSAYFHIDAGAGGSPTFRLLQGGVNKWGWLGEYPASGRFAFYSYDLRDVVMTFVSNGNVGIGTTGPTSKLHVVGDAQIDGNIAAKYQDTAEWVKVKGAVPPGTVMVIDDESEKGVRASALAYDTRVAGVVSELPGILLGEPGDDKAKIAHSGRVKVKADATFGPIAVGDLLVTSSSPGRAMRSDPVSLGGVPIHRPGTLLGKALEPLKKGQGEILILLMLQ